MGKRVVIGACVLLPLLAACASVLHDPLARARVKPGVARIQVVHLLGLPPWTSGSVIEEWRYCRTNPDLIFAVFIREGVVVKRISYRVNEHNEPWGFNGRIGSCVDHIEDNGPGWVRKIRDRVLGSQ